MRSPLFFRQWLRHIRASRMVIWETDADARVPFQVKFNTWFTQGVWANGEVGNGLNYLAFVGNGLNTLNISGSKIDTHPAVSGSVGWEPLGAYGEPGKSRNMYDDYFALKTLRIRIGTSFTRSREERFTNLDQSSPENFAVHKRYLYAHNLR